MGRLKSDLTTPVFTKERNHEEEQPKQRMSHRFQLHGPHKSSVFIGIRSTSFGHNKRRNQEMGE